MSDPTQASPPLIAEEPRWRIYGCLALLLVGLYLILGPKIALSQWQVSPDGNAAMDEALQWQRGSLALSHGFYESAEAGGRYYNVVGLAFTLLAVATTLLTDLLTVATGCAGLDGASAGLSTAQYVALVALPLPLVAFWAFRTITGNAPWAAVMAATLIAGTSLAPVLATCRTGSIYYINHVLAVMGLLIFGAELLGRQRVWPAVAGLCIAAWSRQMTLLYALPLIWIVWRGYGAPLHAEVAGRLSSTGLVNGSPSTPPIRPVKLETGSQPASPACRRLIFALIGVALAAGVPMFLNTLKFGNPLENGYQRLYEGRTDPIGRRAQAALFGLRYVPMHAWAMNLAYPAWDLRAGTLYADVSDVNGGSIWLTSPLLLGVFLTARRWWSDPRRRALMIGTLPVVVGLWGYHTTGADGSGYYRYALDFLPLWLLVISPYTAGRRGRPWALACLAYSALYFSLLP